MALFGILLSEKVEVCAFETCFDLGVSSHVT